MKETNSQGEDVQAPVSQLLFVENSFRPALGKMLMEHFKVEANGLMEFNVVDVDDLSASFQALKPQVVILDVDSLRHAHAIEIAIAIREQNAEQVIMFCSDRINPVLVKEGVMAALWFRSYWINQPSNNPSQVVPEVLRAMEGKRPLNPQVLESAATEHSHVGRLSPQQHRVMRLMSLGASNAKIAKECGITPKAVERTISAASKLLAVQASSPDTNHRVIAATTYRRAVLFADVFEMK